MKRKGFAVIALGAIVALPDATLGTAGTLWIIGVILAVIGTVIVFADEAVS